MFSWLLDIVSVIVILIQSKAFSSFVCNNQRLLHKIKQTGLLKKELSVLTQCSPTHLISFSGRSQERERFEDREGEEKSRNHHPPTPRNRKACNMLPSCEPRKLPLLNPRHQSLQYAQTGRSSSGCQVKVFSTHVLLHTKCSSHV